MCPADVNVRIYEKTLTAEMYILSSKNNDDDEYYKLI